MGQHTDSILAVMAPDTWHAAAAIAEASGLGVRAVAQSLRHLVAAGRVERSEETPHVFRLRDEEGGALAVVEPAEEAPAAQDQPAPVSFAVWDDGSMSLSRAQESMYLSPEEVERMRAHLGRFIW